MCGIVGVLNQENQQPVSESNIRQMLAMIRHRGPDEFGMYLDHDIGLGSARLSIIDLSGGQQPITNEDGSMWIIFNGEIYNYVELRPVLEARGHKFSTKSDTEVILHLYEDLGPDCVKELNGQFAFAIWDANKQSLFLARDRLGIRPMFYTQASGAFIFGSEIKAILADPRVEARLDLITLDQIFTYWSPISPRTAFQGIQELPPGSYTLIRRDQPVTTQRYWQVDFPDIAETRAQKNLKAEDVIESFEELLVDSTQIRLRADVPVGAYLSGGLDSSTTSAIIRNYTGSHLDTFSISFNDQDFDESYFQLQMADFLGTEHKVVHVDYEDIGHIFPNVIWHTEVPILRTAPAPLFLLSQLVQENNYKVVMTGEGADEFLAGYNIFKEAKLRRFWAKQPDSAFRPTLLKKLYPYISDLSSGSGAYLTAFFREGLTDTDDLNYSHAIRWRNTSRGKRLFSSDLQGAIQSQALPTPPFAYPDGFENWHPLNQAQYLEITIFLSEYLLSSQGDRMAAANSVEGRFPFLDHRVVEFCNQLPPHLKLNGMNEKYLLKKLASKWLPKDIAHRTKRPYRAPIHRSFFNNDTPDYVTELLSPGLIQESGLFKPAAVTQMARKVQNGMRLSETDDMALAGILSTQLVYSQFIKDFRKPRPITDSDNIKICYGPRAYSGD